MTFAPAVLALVLAAPAPKRVALTFDDLPGVAAGDARTETLRHITTRLLAQLAREHAPAAVFVNEGRLYRDGRLDPDRVAILTAWRDAGHELGNHSFSHLSLHATDLLTWLDDVARGQDVISGLLAECGRGVRYFRHPFLQTGRDETTRRAVDDFLASRGLAIAKVTIDDSDWVFARALDQTSGEDRERIAAEYVPYMERKTAYFEDLSRRLFGRAVPQVLLLHANHVNAEKLGDLLAMLRRRGYAFVPLGEALADPAYRSPDSFYGGAGISWLERWAMTCGLDRAILRGDPAVPRFVMEAAGVESE